jgi:integrase
VRKRRSEGWFTEITRKSGKTVVLYRWIEGGRGRKFVLGPVETFPTTKSRWKEVFRLGFDRHIEVSGPRTFEDLINHWLEKECPSDDTDPRDRRAFSTRDNYRCCVRKWVLPKWGNRLLTDLKAPDVEDWLAGLRWQVRRSKKRPKEPDKFLPLAPGTKKKIRDVMHLLYEHAKRYGWWPEDRINPISKVRQGGERQTTPIRLNLEELHQLIYEVLKQRERTMVLFDFAGGLRRGELMGSKWKDVDFVQKVFTPKRSVVKMRVGKLKTKGSPDPVPLDDSVIEELLRWRAETPYAADGDYIFASPKMKGKQPYWMSRIMQHFIRPPAACAGIAIKGWHTLRHSYTTLLRQNDNDPKVVQGLLRWASPKMINVYDEAVAPEKRTAHEELLQNLSRRTAKRTAEEADFVSA